MLLTKVLNICNVVYGSSICTLVCPISNMAVRRDGVGWLTKAQVQTSLERLCGRWNDTTGSSYSLDRENILGYSCDHHKGLWENHMHLEPYPSGAMAKHGLHCLWQAGSSLLVNPLRGRAASVVQNQFKDLHLGTAQGATGGTPLQMPG